MWNNTILQKKHQNSLKSRNTIKTFYIDRPPVHLECAVGGGRGVNISNLQKRGIYTLFIHRTVKKVFM